MVTEMGVVGPRRGRGQSKSTNSSGKVDFILHFMKSFSYFMESFQSKYGTGDLKGPPPTNACSLAAYFPLWFTGQMKSTVESGNFG